MSSTDEAWCEWGRRDPYFAVITDPKFRQSRLGEAEMQEFFQSGERHVAHVAALVRRLLGDARFAPARALDFGCGVGRVVVPLAGVAQEVVGVDISEAMLEEARRNCAQRGIGNVRFVLSDDTLSQVEGGFDFVHSFIVIQHLGVPQGRALFGRLVELVAPGGVGALHVTYAKAAHAATFGRPPEVVERARHGWIGAFARRLRPAPPADPGDDPLMQMNCHPLNDLMFLLQRAGIQFVHHQFTDHGGELGVMMIFRRPAAARP